jgi:hypothetical protein
MLVRIIAIDLVAGAALVVMWYFWFLRYNRRKATQVLRWIQDAIATHGELLGVEWLAPSRFKAQLRLAPNLFLHPALVVQLFPREMPFNWLLSKLRKQQETLTFEADLDSAPAFSLEVQNHRWCGRTRTKLASRNGNWDLERIGPYVLTTRNDWQREVTNMMNALVASRECDCLTVCFRRSSPHFSVTVLLDTISPEAQSTYDVFETLRELAAGASASRF